MKSEDGSSRRKIDYDSIIIFILFQITQLKYILSKLASFGISKMYK